MSAPGRASELKSQAVLEAARDPNSPVTPKEAQQKAVQEIRAAGGTAYQFDPNASAEEKAAQIAGSLPPGLKRPHRVKAAGLVSDQVSNTTGTCCMSIDH